MARRSPSRPPTELDAERFWRDFDQAAEQAAAEMGQPPETQPVGEAEKLRLWGQHDHRVDPTEIATHLATSGLPSEMLDPNNPDALALVKTMPDLVPLYSQPVNDPELHQILTKFAQYPFRYRLLAGIDDPHQQVAESNRLDRALKRQMGLSDEQAPPEAAPAVAPPTSTPMQGGATAPGGVYTRPPGVAVPAGAPQPTAPPSAPLDPTMIGG